MPASRYILVFDAIKSILEESGVNSLTISNIAKKCHLHPNTVNYYFNGKSDMLMRFHTYVSNSAAEALPQYYFEVPQNVPEAVKAVARIVDLELFKPNYRSNVEKKLYLHLIGHMSDQPEIRYYLTEKHSEYQIFLRGVLFRYVDAGIINPLRLDEGFSSMMLIGAGHDFLYYYYDSSPEELDIARERARLTKLLVFERHHPFLDEVLGA